MAFGSAHQPLTAHSQQYSIYCTTVRERSERGDRLRGRLAAADGALHIAIPLRGALGAGPVDAPGRRAPRLAVGGPDARCEVRAVAAAGELLGHPVPLDVLPGAGRRLAEVADEGADHGVAPFGLAAAGPAARLPALDEAHQDAGPARWRRVVEGHLHRSGIRDGLPVQPAVAPEGFGVDRVGLDDRAGRHPLGELIAPRRQRRIVL